MAEQQPIQVELAEAFYPLFAKKARYRVAFGGRGSGKSHHFADILILRCYEKKTRALCAREFQTSIKDSVHQLLRDKIEKRGYSGFTVLDNEIRHENGSKIIFKGLKKSINEIKSTEGIDICWVEEAQVVSKASWDILIPTIRAPGAEIWVTFNPGEKMDPTSQLFIEKPLPDALIKKVNYYDNPWFYETSLPKEMEYCRLIDIDDYNHIWVGDYKNPNKGGRVVSGWSFANIDDVEHNPNLRLYLTCDFNVDPLCWVMAHVVQINGKLHYWAFDEIAMGPAGIVDGAEEFYRRYHGHPSGIVITGDASGNSRSDTSAKVNKTRYDLIVHTLSGFGMKVEGNVTIDAPRSNPLKPVRHQTFNRAVRDANGLRRVKINPRCERLIGNMEQLKYIPGSSEIWQPTPKDIEKDNNRKWLRQDPYDAFSYLVCQKEPKLEAIYDLPQVTHVDFKA